jgi:ring-1,2-phenylacetyl-CoA epoxidase subunit PaaC
MYTGEMFEVDSVDEILESHGIVDSVSGLHAPWLAQVSRTLAAATLTMPPPDAWMQKGGKQGRHGEQLGFLLAEMQFLQRAYPGLQW